jgi:hypothetical protein
MRGDQDNTVYFPRSTDDMLSLMNYEWHGAALY